MRTDGLQDGRNLEWRQNVDKIKFWYKVMKDVFPDIDDRGGALSVTASTVFFM